MVFVELEGINYSIVVDTAEIICVIEVTRQVASYTKAWDDMLKKYEEDYPHDRQTSNVTIIRILNMPDLIQCGEIRQNNDVLEAIKQKRDEEKDWIELKSIGSEKKDVFIQRHEIEFARPNVITKNKESIPCCRIQLLSGRTVDVSASEIDVLKQYGYGLKRKRNE